MNIPVSRVNKVQNLTLGKAYDLQDDFVVFKDTIKVLDAENGKTLALLLKNVITDPDLIKAGRNLTTFKGKSERRADASGERRIFKPKSGSTKDVYLGAQSPSVMLGYEASDNYHPCRMTALTRKHRKLFDNDTVKLVQHISNIFERNCPDEYDKQKGFIQECNKQMVIENSVFTSLTVNMTWRTSLHIDKGDFRSGLGNLCVFKYGDYTGGEIMLPNYKVAFDLQEGDVLFMDVHEPHCNNVLQGEGRLSLICYAREQIKGRCADAEKEQIENPVPFSKRNKRAKGPCINCKTTDSVEWRYTKEGECLCNPCGLAYKNNGNVIVPRDAPSSYKPRKAEGTKVPTTRVVGTQEVDCKTLTRILQDYPDINAIKMDIEGSEHDVIKSTDWSKTNINKLVFEYSFDHSPVMDKFYDLIEYLEMYFSRVYHIPSLPKRGAIWDTKKTRGANGHMVWCIR